LSTGQQKGYCDWNRQQENGSWWERLRNKQEADHVGAWIRVPV
jgi:hypothetical protein